jgi:hypothetical protein
MPRGLRLLFYDDTCRRSRFGVGLTHSWIAGAKIYGAVGKFDAAAGFHDWPTALAWLATFEATRPIDEIQFWGHGKWGRVMIDRVALDASWLDADHELVESLRSIRDRMSGPDALWWFRTCETFGAETGHDFARRWTDFFGTRAAGHTYIIGPWQSGLHALRPGEAPTWSAFEGLDEGSPDEPRRALWSVPGAPNTISCMRATLPGWA